MKNFLLGFGPEYCIRKKITIDVKKYKKKGDLTPLINSELNFKGNFSIENKNLDDLSTLKNDYVFQIKFKFPQKNIIFQYQDGKKIEVKDASEKNVFDVIDSFQDKKIDQKIYLNYAFDINGIQIPKEQEKPFSNLPPGTSINVKLDSNSISLKHEGKEFIFCDKEKTSFVTFFFQKFYDISDLSVIIFNGHNIKKDRLLRKGDSINSMNFHIFISNDETDDSLSSRCINIEFSETVSQLRSQLAIIFSEEGGTTLKEENIILTQNKKELKNPTQLVRDINLKDDGIIMFQIVIPKEETKKTQKPKPKKKVADNGAVTSKTIKEDDKKKDLSKTAKEESNKTVKNQKQENDEDNEKQEKKLQRKTSRFKIVPKTSDLELTIHFLFESADKKELQYKLSPSTTIKEIASRIASENDIEGKIEIKYKENNEKFTVDPDMTLDDIMDEMKVETSDKIRYVLYINIKPKTVKPSNVEKPKNKKPKNDKDDDDIKIQKEDSKEVKKPPQKVQKSKESEFSFECQENKQKLKIKSDTTLKDNEQEIRNLFKLDKKVKIQYRTSIDDDSGGELIEDENSKIDKFKGKTIKIQCFTKKPSNFDDLIPGKTVFKYFYQTNNDMENVYEVELESKANVKSMKKIIAFENKIKNLNDIKILFAGKDLMNDLVLMNLNIGDTILFVYIRSQEDILLMTAKALIVNTNIEESESDDSD